MAASTTDFGATLNAAVQGGYVTQLNGGTYTITQPITIYINSTVQGVGIDGGGATLISKVPPGQPVIQFVVGPNVDMRYLDLSNFTIQGNGSEGDGIKIVADGNDRWLYNFSINNVSVNHVGGYGLDVQGSVFEGLISNSWFNNNTQGGAIFEHSANGGQVSALRWFGGGADNNGGNGVTLANGARDMSIDGASFDANHGDGVNAMNGITSVSNSSFQDNSGVGANFQCFGNFNNDSFTSTQSGLQTVGIRGYLAGDATLDGNSAHGGTLATLAGTGNVLEANNTGMITNASGVTAQGLGADNHASVTASNTGVSVPALNPITAADTANLAASNTGSALETALKAAFSSGGVTHIAPASYTVTSSIVIHIAAGTTGPVGIDLGGAKIASQVQGGGPVIEIIVDHGANVNGLTLSNFSIQGNGKEGDGIKIVADGTDRSINNLQMTNVNVEHVGGVGLDVLGNVHGATINDSWMNGDNQGGARFANSVGGGTITGVQWLGGGFRHNSIAGLIGDNGAKDITVKGAYFVDNNAPGINAASGLTLVQASGFENNQGAGAVVGGSGGAFTDDTFSTYGPERYGVSANLTNGTVSLTGDTYEYYGSGANPMKLANIQGTGTVNMAGSGAIVAGSGITVSGANPAVGQYAYSGIVGASVGLNPGMTVPAPTVTSALASDTGSSATDKITSSAALTGTASPGGIVRFTVDGVASSATAMADTTGKWSFNPTGLSDGVHTIVASQTNAAGTGTSSFTVTLDTKAPVVTEALSTTSTATAPVIAGSGDANAKVSLAIDGTAVATAVTADAAGVWTYTPGGLSAGSHTVVATETDAAGNVGSASFVLTVAAPATASTASTGGTGTGTGSTGTGGTGIGSVGATAPGVPVITGGSSANGQLTIIGSTHEASDQVSIYEDGSWKAFVATASDGSFSYSVAGDTTISHTFGAAAVNSAGAWKSGANYVLPPASDGSFGIGAGTAMPSVPLVTEKLLIDDGASASDNITANASIIGTADANATLHLTLDGTDLSTTVTADSSGHWSFTPSNLADGVHSIVVSETANGVTGSAMLTFGLDTKVPYLAFTGETITNGLITVSGTTGIANTQVSIYDNGQWAAFATTKSDGTFSYATSDTTSSVHSFAGNATNSAGVEGHGVNTLITGSSGANTLTGGAGNDVIHGNGGNDRIVGGAGADVMTGGSGNVTFAYNAASESTFAAADTITDFRHGSDKIDFGSIAGLNATNGVPQFQGNIGGTGNLTLNAHSVGFMELGGSTVVLANTSANAETVTSSDMHAADMKIVLTGVNLGLTASDFHHN